MHVAYVIFINNYYTARHCVIVYNLHSGNPLGHMWVSALCGPHVAKIFFV